MLSLIFGNNVVRGDLGFVPDIPYEDGLKVPLIEVTPRVQGWYTLVIIDNDAPYPFPLNIQSPYVHLFVYNLPNGDINKGEYLLEYSILAPPRDSPIHVYHALLYLQDSYLKYTKDPLARREKFPLKELVKYSRLVESVPFTVGDPPLIDSQHLTGNIISPPTPVRRGEHDFFKSGSSLTEQQKKYCSCQLKVQAQGTAYNPYAICAKSVGTTTRECSSNYDFDRMPDNLLAAYLELHKIPYSEERFNRQSALAAIRQKFGK